MVDFFEEVEEDLRAERFERLRKHVPAAIGVVGGVFGLALAYWGFTVYAKSEVDKASVAYVAGMKAQLKGDKGAAAKSFTEAQNSFAPAYKDLSLQQQAGQSLAQKNDAEAIKRLDQAAQVVGSNQILADQAKLNAALLLLDTAPYADLEARLAPLAQPGRPFQAQATEALGMALFRAKRLKEAKTKLEQIRLMLNAPQDVVERVSMELQAIDAGDVDAVAKITKAAAAAPTTPLAVSPAASAGAEAQ